MNQKPTAVTRGNRATMARRLGAMVLASVVVVLVFSPVVIATAISQGYQSTQPVDAGTLVSIDPSTDHVSPANIGNGDGLLGIVVATHAATLAFTNGANQAQVATSGSSTLLVTDLNGPIKVGDQIAPSPIDGVGMKATNNGKVIGIAQAPFDGQKPLKTVQLKTLSGRTVSTAIGTVPVIVQVVYYTATVNTVVPASLQLFANSVAGRPVAVTRLIVVAAIMLVALVVVAILLFSTVRGAIVSIGRNPLARSSIYRGMFQAAAASVAILGMAVGAAFVVLLY